jgi:hypothetical protein
MMMRGSLMILFVFDTFLYFLLNYIYAILGPRY